MKALKDMTYDELISEVKKLRRAYKVSLSHNNSRKLANHYNWGNDKITKYPPSVWW